LVGRQRDIVEDPNGRKHEAVIDRKLAAKRPHLVVEPGSLLPSLISGSRP
jgi:hypothetical protein